MVFRNVSLYLGGLLRRKRSLAILIRNRCLKLAYALGIILLCGLSQFFGAVRINLPYDFRDYNKGEHEYSAPSEYPMKFYAGREGIPSGQYELHDNTCLYLAWGASLLLVFKIARRKRR